MIAILFADLLRRRFFSGMIASILLTVVANAAEVPTTSDWPTVGGDPGGMRHSALADINRSNVHRLKVAWTYRHGDYRSGWPQSDQKGTAFEATPLMVNDRLIFSTPFNRVIALNPETGKPLWTFDPKIDRSRRYANKYVSRGVAYWHDATATGPCASRILLGTLDARLIALDAATGMQLWRSKLPADAMATAMSYQANGRQFVVVAAGGHYMFAQRPKSDTLVGFALAE